MPRTKNPRKFAGRPPRDGSRLLQRVLNENALDQRTQTARALRAIRDDLAADAGGWDHVTSRERLLIERCAAQALIVAAIEAHVFGQPSVIGQDGALLPSLAKGYTAHVQSLARMLTSLGLRPDRADRTPDLQTYMQERKRAAEAAATAMPAADTTPTTKNAARAAGERPAADEE